MDVTDTYNGSTLQLPNNVTMSEIQTGHIPMSESLSLQSTKAHVFDAIHSSSLILLGQICDDDCISILDKNEINILKDSKLILKGSRKTLDGLWYISISNTMRHSVHAIISIFETRTGLIQYLHGCLFSPTSRTFLKSFNNENFLNWPGLKNKKI